MGRAENDSENMTANSKTSSLERVAVNLFSSGLAWIIPVLLSFLTTPLLVRILGDQAYGVRGLIASTVGYFVLLDFGLGGAGTKFLAEYKAKKENKSIQELLGTTLSTYCVFGLLGAIVLWFLSDWFAFTFFHIPQNLQGETSRAFKIASIGFFLNMLTWWGAAIPSGLHRFDLFNGITIGATIANVLGGLAAAKLGYGITGVVTATAASNVLAISGYLLCAKKLLPEIKIRFSFRKVMFKKTILFGAYMFLFQIFSICFSQLDKTFLGILIGAAAVTYYIVPQSLACVVHDINARLMQMVFPMASEFSARKDFEKISQLFYRGANLSIVIGIGIGVPIIFFASELLSFWMTPEFAGHSTLVLRLLVLVFFMTGLTAMPTSILGGLGYPKYIPLGSFVAGISGIVFYALLIKPFGIIGAAAAKCISIFITDIYYAIVCKKKIRGVSFLRLSILFAKPLLASLLVIASLSIMTMLWKIHSLFQIFLYSGVGCILYAGCVWFGGMLQPAEKVRITDFFQKVVVKIRHR
jgi:O-antigen/teichoic acid export membrane protein